MRIPHRVVNTLLIVIALVTVEVVSVIYLAALEPAPTLEDSR